MSSWVWKKIKMILWIMIALIVIFLIYDGLIALQDALCQRKEDIFFAASDTSSYLLLMVAIFLVVIFCLWFKKCGRFLIVIFLLLATPFFLAVPLAMDSYMAVDSTGIYYNRIWGFGTQKIAWEDAEKVTLSYSWFSYIDSGASVRFTYNMHTKDGKALDLYDATNETDRLELVRIVDQQLKAKDIPTTVEYPLTPDAILYIHRYYNQEELSYWLDKYQAAHSGN